MDTATIPVHCISADLIRPSAIICLNATIPPKDEILSFSDCEIFAADGAGRKLIEIGIKPDYVIGDLDSSSLDYLNIYLPKNRIIKIDEQETNDFEKNLKHAISLGHTNILIIGFHGGELEHTLNNMSVFHRFSEKINLFIYDQRRLGIMLRKGIFNIALKLNELISLTPQPYAKISTTGLKWELKSEVLSIGIREGARNRALKELVEIEVIEGELCVFINAKSA
jgi:thiamine pyrophosphokinase